MNEPFAVWHFHNSKLDTRNVGLGMLEIGVAKDRVVFGLGELKANIWQIQHPHS